jgi:NtrC-family two-component system response regulator AlgB
MDVALQLKVAIRYMVKECLFLEWKNPAMCRLLRIARQVAASDATILLIGESGSGKRTLARQIHGWSRRRKQPFIVVNCLALSERLQANKGFLGDAQGGNGSEPTDKSDPSEEVVGGTVFLDEIAALSPRLTEQLPRLISGQTLQQVVPESDQRADVRIIAATSRDPTTAVSAHRLFEDLLCNLSEIVLRLPPLREHPEDIEPLAKRLLSNIRARRGLSGLHMTGETGAAIARLPWLGNIAELQKAIEIAAANAGNKCITPECLSQAMSTDQSDTVIEAPLRSLEEVERRHIMRVLAEAPTLAHAAETLGINSSTLWRKRRLYKIDGPTSPRTVASRDGQRSFYRPRTA